MYTPGSMAEFPPFTCRRLPHAPASLLALVAVGAMLACGCSLNKSRLATEQLVISDAVDRAVAEIDFSPLSGHKVHFDTKYLANVKLTPTTGNTEYVVSSLRQQMAAYDCRLVDKPEEADYIVEARIGVLAHDGHEVTYGMPGTAAASTASALFASPIPLPSLPELSLGRRNYNQGTAKIGVFAYDRQTREPVWQSGLAKGSTRARDLWAVGLGPFVSSSPVVKRGGLFGLGRRRATGIGVSQHAADPHGAYAGSVVFQRAIERNREASPETGGQVQTASHEEPAKLNPPDSAKPATAASATAETRAKEP